MVSGILKPIADLKRAKTIGMDQERSRGKEEKVGGVVPDTVFCKYITFIKF